MLTPLAVVLPVDIHSPFASYATQFGLVQRPTHRNTSHDQAKFEVCAHGFGDLSEAGYGLALASRHKYGYAVEGNTIRLSLLRSSTSPDPTADQGEHAFAIAIIPHRGQLAESAVGSSAFRFNNEVYLLPELASTGAHWPTFAVSGEGSDGIVLETIKRGEDDVEGGKGKSVVLRMYENAGGRAKGTLSL